MKTIKPKTCLNLACGKPFTPVRFLQSCCGPSCQIAIAKENWPKKAVLKANKAVSTPKENPIFVKNREARKRSVILLHGRLLCEQCGSNGKMVFHTHHIIFRSEKPNHPHLHDEINLMIVCEDCHDWFHKSKGNRDEVVKARCLDTLFGPDVLNKSKL